MSKLARNASSSFIKSSKDENMCSANELKEMISSNNVMLEGHIKETTDKFESVLDTITRIAHQSEKTALEFTEHKAWEETYRKRQELEHSNVVAQISNISTTQKTLVETQNKLAEGNEIILDFVSKKNALLSLGSGIRDIALWIVAIGSASALIYQFVQSL